MSEEKNVTLEQDVLVEKEVVNAPAEPVTEAESSEAAPTEVAPAGAAPAESAPAGRPRRTPEPGNPPAGKTRGRPGRIKSSTAEGP